MKWPGGILAAVLLFGGAVYFWRDAAPDSPPGTTPHSVSSPAGADNSLETPPPGTAADVTLLGGDPNRKTEFDCSIDDFVSADEAGVPIEQQLDEFRARVTVLTDLLSTSSDLQHQLAASLLKIQADDDAALDILNRLVVAMPDNPVLHWRLLDACDDKVSHPLCANRRAETLAIARLGDNGEAWGKIAHYRIKRGDDSGGLQALLNGAAAAEFDNYWGQEANLLFQGLAIESNQSVPERIGRAVGLANLLPLPGLDLVRQCRERAAASPNWLQACSLFAARMATDSRTILGRSVGLGLQDAMSSVSGSTPNPRATESRDRALLQQFTDSVGEDGQLLLAADETIGLAWLDRLANSGEIAAARFLRSEVMRVRQDPDYNPCPSEKPAM